MLVLCVGIELVCADDDWEDFICFGKPTDALIAHPTECSLFFLCDGGVGYKNRCPQNTFFDPEKKHCDPEYRCNPPNATTSIPHASTTASYPNSSTSKPPMIPSNHTIKCPPDDTANVTMLANPINCNEYYLCYYGKAMRFECPQTYVFSTTEKACIPAEQSACDVSQLRQSFMATNLNVL